MLKICYLCGTILVLNGNVSLYLAIYVNEGLGSETQEEG